MPIWDHLTTHHDTLMRRLIVFHLPSYALELNSADKGKGQARVTKSANRSHAKIGGSGVRVREHLTGELEDPAQATLQLVQGCGHSARPSPSFKPPRAGRIEKGVQ
ncbi:hypothetical protein [Microbispora bryophytorum]|uniref:hypothetical protein n=1 Tax=Microbispora bryophytorum TaxID=1460882 RepID=UPI003722B237